MPRSGRHTELHFSIMAWMLEGPARTKRQLEEEFMINSCQVKVFFDALLRLKLLEKGPRRCMSTTNSVPTQTYLPKRTLTPSKN